MGATDDLITRCKTRFKDSGNAIVADAEWLNYLNDTYDEINGASPWWPWFELQNTAVTYAGGVNTATLPTDGWRVSAVWNDTDNYALAPSDNRSAYRSQFPTGSEDQGTPGMYRLRNRTLEIWPYPDHAITLVVDYFGPPAALVATGTDVEPVWPRWFTNALVEGALGRAYMDDGNMEWATGHREIMKGIVENMARDVLSPRTETYSQINDDWYG